MKKKRHHGSSIESFLTEEGILDEATTLAVKRVIAWQIADEMRRKRLTKTEMAQRMQTTRAQLDRLLDPENSSVTLATLTRAAHAVGKTLRVELA